MVKLAVTGSRIIEARHRQKLSIRALAELVGVRPATLARWEHGARPNARAKAAYEQMIDLLEIDVTARQEEPRTEPPVAASRALRISLSTPEDEFAYNPRKIEHSLAYLNETVPQLLKKVDRQAREIHRLEVLATGITAEQVGILRDKARRWDDLQAIMSRNSSSATQRSS